MTQAMQALARANELRFEGAAARREIRALPGIQSRHRAADILTDPSEGVKSMRLSTFLGTPKQIGPSKATELVRKAEVGRSFLTQPIRRLTAGQRERLAGVMRAVGV